jgi:hypothetical protein
MTTPLVVAGDDDAEPEFSDVVTTFGDKPHTFRDGSTMVVDKEAFGVIARGLLHSPAVVAALTDKVQQMADHANSIAQQPGADYAVTIVSDWPDSKRARANVWTSNHAAMLDDAKHSTLFKTLAHFGGTATQ